MLRSDAQTSRTTEVVRRTALVSFEKPDGKEESLTNRKNQTIEHREPRPPDTPRSAIRNGKGDAPAPPWAAVGDEGEADDAGADDVAEGSLPDSQALCEKPLVSSVSRGSTGTSSWQGNDERCRSHKGAQRGDQSPEG